MIIGTDISPVTCREEGYLQMEFKKRELFTKGKLNPDATVDLFATWPAYEMEAKGYTVFNGRCMYDAGWGSSYNQKTQSYRMYRGKHFCAWPKMFDECYSAQDIWDIYKEHQKEVDGITGMTEHPHEFPKCEYTLLHLATDVMSTGRLATTCGAPL